ncbi:MAG: DUF4080 domain-containing protein [Mogibacterium sp.]|nr:DUF4080 domain-containing protein [Mogibacterium sp.]
MKLLLTTVKTECRQTELALRYLYAIFADSPIEVDMKCFDMSESDLGIYEEIVKGQYNIVYFHTDKLNDLRIAGVAELVKKAMPVIVTVAGGMQVSFETRKWMKEVPWIDYVIRGEGETVLYKFIRSLVEYEFEFDEIDGLAYRMGDQIVVNPFDDPVEMEQLPFPYDNTGLDGGIIYYESIRGSSDRSVYTQHMPDARVRALPLTRVFTELRYFIVSEAEKVVFLDRWFNYSADRAYRIFEYIIDNDNGITTFEFDVCGENLDDETIRLLSDAREGLFEFNIDIASVNEEVLTAIGRKSNIYQMMYNVSRMLQTCRVAVKLSVTAGLPLETEAMFADSFNKAYGLSDGMPVRIDMLSIVRGTILSTEADKFGYIYKSTAPYDVISTKYMSPQDLIRIRTMRDVVYRFIGNGAFKVTFTRILRDTGIKPYEMFRALTKYVYRNGLDKEMCSSAGLARILYAFAGYLYETKEQNDRIGELRDCLMSDLNRLLSDEDIVEFERKGWEIEH